MILVRVELRKRVHFPTIARSTKRVSFQGLLERPHDFLEMVPFSRRPNLGLGMAHSAVGCAVTPNHNS